MSKTKRTLLIVAGIVGALLIIAGAFFAGFFVRGAYGVNSYDWVLKIIDKYYYLDVDAEDANEVSIDALVKEYLDIYSEYYTAEQYEAEKNQSAGNQSGLGITFMYLEGTGALVVYCAANSPAYIAGIRSGDVLLSGEYQSVKTQFDSYDSFVNFVSAQGVGEEATYYTADSSHTVIKAEYSLSYVSFATNTSGWYFSGNDALTLTESEGDAITYLPEGTAYIELSQFYGNAPAQFRSAVKKIKSLGCSSIILDLRNDGGGYVSVMQEIGGCFSAAAGKTAMTAKYKSGKTETYYCSSYSADYTFGNDIDVYVLANGNTASASEALIGVLVSYGILDLGNIYISEYSEEYLAATGQTAESSKSGRTYGKGIMQSTFVYHTGEALKLTTAQIFWPNGTSIHGKGLSSADGCKIVAAPYPGPGDGQELKAAVSAIFS